VNGRKQGCHRITGKTTLRKHRTNLNQIPAGTALHRWFFPLAVLGGVLLVLLPMYLQAPMFSPRLAWAAAGILLHALAGTLAVSIAPLSKRLLFGCGLLPFALQLVASPGKAGWLFSLALLFFAQILRLAFAPVRTGKGLWLGFLLTGAVLFLLYGTLCLPLLLCAAVIPLRRWIPLGLLSPAELPDTNGLRRKQRLLARGKALRVLLVTAWSLGVLYMVLFLLPSAGFIRVLSQTPAATLLREGSCKLVNLQRLLCAGIYPDADFIRRLYSSQYRQFHDPAGLSLHTGLLPLAWAVLLVHSAVPAAGKFCPVNRRRAPAFCMALLCLIKALYSYFVWNEHLISAAQSMLCFLPVLLWSLTPRRLVLRKENPAVFALCTAALLVLTAVPVLGACL
jgi:hypothetical protein